MKALYSARSISRAVAPSYYIQLDYLGGEKYFLT